ncbi:MAG: hypothetical protein JXO44_05015, partial [Clostridia bacterium]|nr:hypothetical protein [Clostridia bacterium]
LDFLEKELLMGSVSKKIGFYTLKLKRKRKKEEYVSPEELNGVFSFIDALADNERVQDFSTAQAKKFHFLLKQTRKDAIQKILFCSAKYNHRPPLVDKDTASRRSNPKLLTEGEEERTHIVFKYKADEIVAIMEEHRSGISINRVAEYLSSFADTHYKNNNDIRNWKFEIGVIPKENFLGEMERLERVLLGEVYTENRLLGSEYLNYSNRTESLRNDLVISIKAQPKKSIIDAIKDIYTKFTGGGTEIQKIRIKGVTDVGTEVVLDTDIMKKIHYLDTEINESDGVVVSKQFFEQLVEVVSEY